VFVFPSETETFGNVVVEAAASGLPAIVAATGASHEHVVDGVTGTIVDGSDHAAIAGATLRLLGDHAARARMSRAARQHARRYDLLAAVHETWAIYERIVAGGQRLEAAS
jgi:glycosyltransferase involved in cell wall biosynthesis